MKPEKIDTASHVSQRALWAAAGACSLLVLIAFISKGYAAGYGSTTASGEVVFERDSIFSQMQVDYSRDDGEWAFGYAIPFAIILLFWIRRKEFLKLAADPAAISGGLILSVGCFLYWAGYRGEQKYFGYMAGQILALGAIVWFLGWAWFRQLFWMWVLLGMMWPWRFLVEHVSAPLQKIMVVFTSGFLQLVGVGAVSNGSSILTDSNDPKTGEFINLDIDVACSGMRSLFALIMIGLVFTCLPNKGRSEWKRWVLIASVPFLAIIGNFLRMLMLYYGSVVVGTEVAIGKGESISTFHMVAGLLVFAFALVALSFLRGLLNDGFGLLKGSGVRRTMVSSSVN